MPQHDGIDIPRHGADQGFAGAAAGLAHIDMGIGAIAGHDGDVIDHDSRQVGMEIKRHGDGDIRRGGPDAAQQLALAVVMGFRHHGAVQIQHDAVASRPDRITDCIRHFIKGGLVHGAGWIGIGDHGHGVFGPFPFRDVHIGGDGVVGAAIDFRRPLP